MYNLALTVQIIATLICFISVLIVAFQKPSSYSNVIVITFLCTFTQNGGYILELLARDVNQGIFAVKAEYLGGAFEIGLITFFMFKYCGFEFNNILKGLLIFEGAFVIFGVWTWEYTGFYYTGVSFVSDAEIPYLVLEHGWLYFTFAIVTVVELISCIFILMVSVLRTNQEHMKTNYFILMAVVSVPLIGYVVSVSGLITGFDATPISAAIAVGIFAFAIARKHVFDVADAAGGLILANLESAIVILNNDNGYEYSNKRAEELFPSLKEYSRGTIVKHNEILKLFENSLNGVISIGSRIFEVNVNSVQSSGENIGKTAILFDVTDARTQMEQMKTLKDEAEEANRSKSVFLASVSHEIRTPINVVMGMSEVLLRDYATDETKEYIQNIRNSGNTLLYLISDIIDYSKIESGKLELISDRFDMQRVLNEIVNVYQFRCEQKELEFIYDIASEIPRFLIGDDIRVRQIATNLLSNSVKYTEKGSVKFKLGFKHRSDYDIDLIMAVEDTGRGIKKEDYDKLFKGFGREQMAGYQISEGTGLGLNITKQLTELMGGVINFKSEVGKGTTFSVIIPIIQASDSTETVGNEIGKKRLDSAFKTTFTATEAEILIVDDSSINQKIIKELLKDINPKLTAVSSGEECLEYVREKHFDLIFMDHRMSGMDGVETFSRIKQSDNECKDTPVVMITANATLDSRDWYLAKGFADFLPMPIDSEQLSNMLYKFLPERLIVMNE